jgi:hypothetical protein
MYGRDPRVITWRDALVFAATGVAKYVSSFVLPGLPAVRSCQLLTRFQNPKLVFIFAHLAVGLHFTVDQSIQLASGFIVGRNNKRPLFSHPKNHMGTTGCSMIEIDFSNPRRMPQQSRGV